MRGRIVIEIDGLTKRYGDKTAVDGLSYESRLIPPGAHPLTVLAGEPPRAGETAYRRRAAGCRAGLTHPPSAGLMVTPGGTILSMRSSTSTGSVTPAVASWDSRWSIVRGPMIAAVTAG